MVDAGVASGFQVGAGLAHTVVEGVAGALEGAADPVNPSVFGVVDATNKGIFTVSPTLRTERSEPGFSFAISHSGTRVSDSRESFQRESPR